METEIQIKVIFESQVLINKLPIQTLVADLVITGQHKFCNFAYFWLFQIFCNFLIFPLPIHKMWLLVYMENDCKNSLHIYLTSVLFVGMVDLRNVFL